MQQPELSRARKAATSRRSARTQALAHGQVGVDDVLAAQQKDVPDVDVVRGHVHAEQLQRAALLLLRVRQRQNRQHSRQQPPICQLYS
jgi:hypothetical protein